jgi:type 1 glutamine amidotransferase
MRVLVLCDDHWHPGATIRGGIDALETSEFEFDWIENGGEWSAERMAAYPLVILSKSDNTTAADDSPWVDEQVQRAFLEYVRQGGGLLAVHSGTVYADYPTMRGLIGGAFLNHPPQCPVTVEPQPGHPLTAGSAPFTAVDEHYQMALDDGQADVFLTTTSEHGTQPGGWTRTEGEGRVCVLTPGHNLEIWVQPSFQALLLNALRWCSREPTGSV